MKALSAVSALPAVFALALAQEPWIQQLEGAVSFREVQDAPVFADAL